MTTTKTLDDRSTADWAAAAEQLTPQNLRRYLRALPCAPRCICRAGG